MKQRGFRTYSFLSAIGLILGESWFVFTTNKFAPLWIDDYAIAVFMLIAVRYWPKPYGPAMVFGGWMFITGNLYAMLFGRLEPVNPAGRPWKLLAVLVVWSGLSALAALYQVKQRAAQAPTLPDHTTDK